MSYSNLLFGENINSAYNLSMQLTPSTFGYKTNNQYDNFPANMSDGRSLIASYQPEAIVNNEIIKENNIKSNWEYRKYLTQNSQSIREINTNEAYNDVGYYKRNSDFLENSSTPAIYNSLNDNSKIIHSSDLKDTYLSREQLNARKSIPSFSASII